MISCPLLSLLRARPTGKKYERLFTSMRAKSITKTKAVTMPTPFHNWSQLCVRSKTYRQLSSWWVSHWYSTRGIVSPSLCTAGNTRRNCSPGHTTCWRTFSSKLTPCPTPTFDLSLPSLWGEKNKYIKLIIIITVILTTVICY